MLRIGIDVGGTFTDVVLFDTATGKVWAEKVPTTPENPSIGTLAGIRRALKVGQGKAGDLELVAHGTTIATNLIVEGKGAATALIATEGFRDILEIRRSARHDRADLYDLHFTNPPPLVRRSLRLEAKERILHDGSVETPITEQEIERLLSELKKAEVKAVAVCFMHSHVNAAHETKLAAALRKANPDLFVSVSCEVNPEIFEYERTSTTVINAMLGPKCGDYVRNFEKDVRAEGIRGAVLFMQSNGGLMPPAVTARKPIALLESGPAGGVTAAVKLCKQLGIKNAILGDMGGTTFDVSLIRDSEPEMRSGGLVRTYAVRAPTIDIESVGAGGGSLAYVDEAGGVHVGPESAGAYPGPACYGRGGTRPTVTDCNLVLGYLEPESFPVDIPLNVDAAHRAIETEIANPLRCSVLEAAAIVRALANANMAEAVRLMTVQRGFDPREFTYICFGGAGPVHASDLARDLEIPRIVVPPLPGLFSASGMIVADETHQVQAPVGKLISEVSATQLESQLSTLHTDVRALFSNPGASVTEKRYADCRYINQAEAITVEIPGSLNDVESQLRGAFEAAHKRNWNFIRPTFPIVLVNLRLVALAETGVRLELPPLDKKENASPYKTRRLFLDKDWIDVPTYRREDLHPAQQVVGPAFIEEASSSLFLQAGDRLSLHPTGSMQIARQVQ